MFYLSSPKGFYSQLSLPRCWSSHFSILVSRFTKWRGCIYPALHRDLSRNDPAETFPVTCMAFSCCTDTAGLEMRGVWWLHPSKKQSIHLQAQAGHHIEELVSNLVTKLLESVVRNPWKCCPNLLRGLLQHKRPAAVLLPSLCSHIMYTQGHQS